MKRFHLSTFGCQMNEHDSEIMARLLKASGYQPVENPNEAELLIINTCSIREKSYQKAVSRIGGSLKGRKEGGRPIVAVTGCVASHDGKNLLKRFPFIDIALGPDHLQQLPQLVSEVAAQKRRFAVTDFTDLSDYEFPTPIARKSVKAYVTVMKGCDNTCSFCIVPFVRGPEVSRPGREIVEEIQKLEGEGVREVMLLGQNVNSYGKRLAEKTTFAKLLRRIDEETEIPRIRFTSPHPKDLSDSLIEEYGRNQKLCPHIHLPVQSGSNRILKRMRRSYTREVYLRKVQKIRAVCPTIAITTDLIVGFPGETEEFFQETLSLVREVGFDASYSFLFSPRPRTEAAQFQDDVPLGLKKERLFRLQQLQEEISLEKNRLRIGRTEEVLVEGASTEGLGQLTGRTPHHRIVNFDGDEKQIGAILKIRMCGASPYSLRGEVDAG